MEQKKVSLRIGSAVVRQRAQRLNEMYNQNIASQDSQKTSFIYHKILAIQFVIALFSVVCIFISLMLHFQSTRLFSQTRCKYLLGIFTALTIVAIFLETKCRIKWNDQKKQPQIISFIEYLWWFVESVFILPVPNFWFDAKTGLYNYKDGNTTYVDTDALFTVYLLMRSVYVLKFMVHSESYYGSRPDRLSRLYAVKFGTFNAVKYLINEKPFASLLVIYLMLFLELPLALFIIEGPINSRFNDYSSCVYFGVICMSTVGYGDTNPVTWIGRFLAILMIVLGNCFTSLVLIFIIRSITFSSPEEDAHFLRGQLEVKYQVRKALVRRIEEEWRTKHSHCCAEEKQARMMELKNFRLQNRRMLHASKTQPGNLKRLMLKNFSQLLQQVQNCRDKQQLLRQYCDVIQQSQNNHHKTIMADSRNSPQYNLLEEKIINNPSPDVTTKLFQ